MNDRNLRLLSIADPVISDIERHEAIVTIHAELDRLVHTSPYILEAEIYLPASERKISSSSTIFEQLPKPEYDALKAVKNRFDNPFIYWHGRLFISFPYSSMAIMGDQEPVFVIGVELNLEQLRDALAGFAIGGSGGSMLIDQDGRWRIAGNGHLLPQAGIDAATAGLTADAPAATAEKWIEGRKYWIAAERSKTMGVTLLSYMPESDILGSLVQYRIWYWVLAVLSVLMIALFAYWIFLQIHQPMRRLMRAFQKVENGNWKLALVHRRQDEFGHLYSQFNSMVAKIDELVHEVYEQQYRANLSELRQLQSQINPHF
ncbi:sensor histidine kinase, partial [Cohnella nanjingensis]